MNSTMTKVPDLTSFVEMSLSPKQVEGMVSRPPQVNCWIARLPRAVGCERRSRLPSIIILHIILHIIIIIIIIIISCWWWFLLTGGLCAANEGKESRSLKSAHLIALKASALQMFQQAYSVTARRESLEAMEFPIISDSWTQSSLAAVCQLPSSSVSPF